MKPTRPAVLRLLPFLPVAVSVSVGVASFVACSSSTAKPANDESRDEFAGETRDTEIKHEPCETGGHTVRTFDAQDPIAPGVKPFVTHVFDGDHEICSFADLNGDGRVDVYTYFGADRKVRRRESAYSVDKRIDEIALYKDGEIDVVMRDTSFDGRLDTWDFYQGGKLVRRERDKNGDGRIDEWWTFTPPGSDNATIVQADPRTGKPDPSSTIKLGVALIAPTAPTVAEYKKPKDGGAEAGASLEAGPPPPGASVLPPTDTTFADAGGRSGGPAPRGAASAKGSK